jgi:predicted amidohydrolase
MSEEDARPFAEVLTAAKPGSSMATMPALSRKLRVAIAWGLVEEDPGTGLLYNTQVLVTPSGEWVSYRKGNSWGNDYLWSQPGDSSPPILMFEDRKVGLLICADVRGKSDKIEEFYEPGDADIVCFSANWGDGGFPAGKWVKFAKENRCTFVVSNRYGREANNNFGEGGICIIDPSGKVHCDGLKWNEPCVVYFDAP